jgi:hypothetical protein
MVNKITYYVILDRGATVDRPLGLLRRLEHDDGPDDEGLNADLSWSFSPLIIEWERGSYSRELVEVSHEQASRIVQYFKQKFAAEAESGSRPETRPGA